MAVRASAVGLDFLVVGLYLWLQLRHQSHLPTARYCGGRLSSTPAQGKLFSVIFLYLGHLFCCSLGAIAPMPQDFTFYILVC